VDVSVVGWVSKQKTSEVGGNNFVGLCSLLVYAKICRLYIHLYIYIYLLYTTIIH
jgi:hypothetical protein